MRKLKALVRQWSIAQQHYYQPLVDKLQQCSIHTVHDLFQANLDSLVSLTNSRRQIIRAFREQVILDSMAKEASFQPKDVVTFSTGFATLDRSLGGGIRLGEVTEICGTAQSGRAKYVQQIMENFLLAFEQSSMHHIDTTGLFDAKSIQTQLLPRIHCNKAFSIPAVITVLESVGAFQAVDGLPTMIVLDNMASVLDSNWQAGFHECLYISRVFLLSCNIDVTAYNVVENMVQHLITIDEAI
ncbi:uncharacterized protein BYT42DRAFT_582214 [Radiomyces spectabilis]|uniref:uncharacterized protein n=1 Tax=Radiomyces spectabilis TaxID=64574 RepID=UPI00221E582F|nr:uncharacterized protein BYT42DRAFT_582214 [Radiomyces spectabilis]KAI8370389.1 hypothetical protein BYT42DRAFT_582214 [Radiomyces spectabilis]